MTDYLYPSYVQNDGTIIRHYICDTTQERDNLSPPQGSTVFVREQDAFYVRQSNATWASASAGVHDHDARYSLASHAHGGASEAFPVGADFISVVPDDPADLLGYGTWAAFGAGRVLVGQDALDPDFDTAEETGGAKTVTLTTNEMPSHTHVEQNNSATTGSLAGWGARDTSTNTPVATGYSTQATGGGAAHTNVQPYIVVYMWKRTA